MENNAILNLLNETLGNNERFTLSIIGRFDFNYKIKIVHLKDIAKRPILTIKHKLGINTRYRKEETVIHITNASGQTLLTGRGLIYLPNTIWTGAEDVFLGKLELRGSSSNLVATGASGEELFHSESDLGDSGGCCCHPSASEFALISNGVRLAHIRRSDDGLVGAEMELINSRNMDSRMKAILIFAGYRLVILHEILVDKSP